MWFDIDQRSSTPIYRQLVDGVKQAVARGILVQGEKLPSVRELAVRIAINPNTIAKAYQELEREEVIETLRGKGTFVAAQEHKASEGEKKRVVREMAEKFWWSLLSGHQPGRTVGDSGGIRKGMVSGKEWGKMTWALETIGLTKVFNGETAVDGCTLQVPEGSVFGLMGPNGAGKTTLIKMLMRALLPTAGSGRILGREIPDPTGEVKQKIGYVADTQQMYPHFKVEEILKFCSMVYRSWDGQRCRTLLKSFGLPQDKQVRSLSKGMKTQLGLIIALSVRPRLLILDEPASGLDPVLHHHFMQLIMQEAAREGTTVFSPPTVFMTRSAPDQVAVIMKGKILMSKPLDELKSSSRKIRWFFGRNS